MTPHRCAATLRLLFHVPALPLFGLLLFSAAPAFPAEPPREFVEVQVWADLEPMFAQTNDLPISRDEARRRMLEDARYVLSGMIYGFRFRYVPSDNARAIGEEFELTPVAQIPFGDDRLRVREVWPEDAVLHSISEYRLREFQRSRLKAWYSSSVPEVEGAGEAEMWDGPPAKRDAITNAVKRAVREHLRGLTHNKPREASGSVLFVESPRLRVDAGAYKADVRVRLKIDEIRDYRVF